MNVCVFEDERALGRVIADALSPICDSVLHFVSLWDFQSHRATLRDCPDLIWMDLRAHDSTIDEAFLEMMAIRDSCPNSIIVVMTGVPEAGIHAKAMAAGADAVAKKPFKITPLDLARLIAVGAINAMQRGASDSPKVLQSVCSMACRYFEQPRPLCQANP